MTAAIGAFLAALGVGAGAFGAHGLRDILSPEMVAIWEKAVLYHLVHALGILLVSTLPPTRLPHPVTSRIALLLCFGTLVFSGSLYLLALTGIRWLGAVTPIGGTAFIVGWLWLAIALARRPGGADLSPR